ncbi:Acetate--CoA ligase [ADP-forming] I [Candidatus Gugararchaeum adminiculabundum]|nr:Acetate--CoA ligase [ADP-forming] I [Candidatus Gugararchaeum adminiculabundum]
MNKPGAVMAAAEKITANSGVATSSFNGNLLSAQKTGMRLQDAIEILRQGGIGFNGKVVHCWYEAAEALQGKKGLFSVKAAVNTTGKSVSEHGIFFLDVPLNEVPAKVNEVLNNMENAGMDKEQGVLIQPMAENGLHMMADMRQTPFGPVVILKLGGDASEEKTITVKAFGEMTQKKRERLEEQIAKIPAIKRRPELVKPLADFAEKLLKIGKDFPHVGEIEMNPLICYKDGRISPVDLRAFTSNLEPGRVPAMSQEEFNRLMDCMVNPAVLFVVAPNGKFKMDGGVERFLMTANAMRTSLGDNGCEVYFIHPKKDKMDMHDFEGNLIAKDVKCYPTVRAAMMAIRDKPDCLLVCLPPKETIEYLEECLELGIPSAVFMGAGFNELGGEGDAYAQRIRELMASGKMVIIGPNTVGMQSFLAKVDSSFSSGGGLGDYRTPEGGEGICAATQSGGVMNTIVNFVAAEGERMDVAVGLGNMLGIEDIGLLAEYFATRPGTKVAQFYLEGSISPAFVEAVKRHSKDVAFVVMCAGKSESAKSVKNTHTDALMGDYEAVELALRDAGAIIVRDIEQMKMVSRACNAGMDVALAAKISAALEKGEPAPGVGLFVQSGADGRIFMDVIEEQGMKLAPFSPEIKKQMREMGFIGDYMGDGPYLDLGAKPDMAGVFRTVSQDAGVAFVIVATTKIFWAGFVPSWDGTPAVMYLGDDPTGNITKVMTRKGKVNVLLETNGEPRIATFEGKGWPAVTRNPSTAVEFAKHMMQRSQWLAENK